MYEYEFVRVPCVRRSLFRWGPKQELEPIVREYAARGCRLVEIFAPPVGVYGRARYFDLIFERARR
jgi:hypothetical protein